MFEKVAVLGVGLMGASFALAAREKGVCRYVVGFGRNRENLVRAKERGIIDAFETDPVSACDGADLVVLSTPVGTFLELIGKTSRAFRKGAVITDTGSVKGPLVYQIEKMMPADVYYIGSHPIAGGERSGIDASDAALFRGVKCIVTPTADSDTETFGKIIRLWESLGSKVITMEPERHDRIYAAVSHLPHVIAYALVGSIADMDASFLDFCGKGFRDTTRIACSSPEIWRDICILNKDNLLDAIEIFKKNLDALSGHLRDSDSEALEREFAKARTLRKSIGQD